MSPLAAQLPTPPPRTDYVFHVYTDPLYGDDALAWAQNPGIANNITPLAQHPDNTTVPRPVGGLLQHAPYAFKTLTGTQGAVAYVRQLTNTYGTGSPRTFPWTFTINGVVKRVTEVVIHCLPGIYGPVIAGQSPIDVRSGLPFNGEVWPVSLDDHVSLQGTSALDTIFDARRLATAIIAVQMPFGTRRISHADSMIDGLTIRGARSDGQPMSPLNITGAGVYIGREARIAVTISNCFFTDNTVAIAIDSDDGGPEEPFRNEPRIINNTIAWNTVGIWNGNTGAPLGQANVGLSTPVVLNNVFDSGTPYPNVLPSLSAFEGVHPSDLTVTSRTLAGATTQFLISFNAWEANYANIGAIAAPNWPAPALRPPLVAPAAPGVDITAYTKLPGGARGSLYVNDIFRHAAAAGVPRLSSDHSPHDFRLSPNASTTTGAPPAPPAGLNPLVDHGLWLPPGPGPSFITMANGIIIAAAPGLPATAEDFATLHAWDQDAEGFGNPRVVAPAGYPPPPPPFPDRIDLGADELDKLLMAGFIEGTRIFSAQVPNAPAIPLHLDVYFFDLKTSSAGGGPYTRPQFNSWTGRTWLWWPHAQGAPDAQTGTNYTAGVANLPRWGFIILTGQKPTFMRSLECDISPHLYLDPHPLWGLGFDQRTMSSGDIYALNPWYQGNPVNGGVSIYDNPMLYYNPPPGYPVHGGYWASISIPNVSAVLSGVANPPGTAVNATASHLLQGQPTVQFGPFSPCQNSSSTSYSVGAWGFGDTAAGCPDSVPWVINKDWLGIRYNCEVGPGSSNLQTFLGINGPLVGGGQSSSPGRSPASVLPRRPKLEEVGKGLRASAKLLEKKR